MSTYNRLGRGLESLIPSVKEMNNNNKLVESTQEISISSIRMNPYQPRQRFKESSILELSESIKQYGVVQPVLVRKVGDAYELIAGERRYRASQKAGLTSIPVVVKDLTDEESLQIALIENLDREDLNPIEEARGYKRLMDEFSYAQQEVANSFQKSRSAIANTLRLLQLPMVIQDGLLHELISEGHGRALLGLKDVSLMDTLFNEVVSQKLSVRQTENKVKELNSPSKKEVPSRDLVRVSKQFSARTGLKTSVKGSEEKGTLEIKFKSKQQLNEILALLA